MSLAKYTSYDEIRAILSLTEAELEDSTLALQLYETQLQELFYEIDEELLTQYDAIERIGVSSRTRKQQRFFNLAQAFSSYGVCNMLLESLPLLTVKKEQDARAQYEHFDAPFEDIASAVKAGFSTSRSRLIAAFNDLGATQLTTGSKTWSITGTAGIALDPVTNT